MSDIQLIRVRFRLGSRVGKWLLVTDDELKVYRQAFQAAGLSPVEEH